VPARKVGRIQTRTAFGQLQRSRARASSGPIRATFVPADDNVGGLYPQVGYAIGTHCGNAVTRNALRRRMREVARAAAPTLPRGTYLLRVDPAGASAVPVEFRGHVAQALQRAGRSTRAGS
jgi:ribonuclease P protein component